MLSAVAVLSLALGACGGKVETEEGETASAKRGAELFNQRCSGCHTLDSADARGSTPEGQVSGGERTNGPNFNTRTESTDDVLYAIRNGGFSGAIMPANIVVGEEANAVAEFVCRYAGGYDKNRDCTIQPVPQNPQPPGEGGPQREAPTEQP